MPCVIVSKISFENVVTMKQEMTEIFNISENTILYILSIDKPSFGLPCWWYKA